MLVKIKIKRKVYIVFTKRVAKRLIKGLEKGLLLFEKQQ